MSHTVRDGAIDVHIRHDGGEQVDRPHWKPLPADTRDALVNLARYMRLLLDRHGLSLRKLAADDDVHYSLTTLHRYFSGQALPPRHLVELVSLRCRGDLCEMFELHERARRESSNSGDLQLRVAVSEDGAASGGAGLSTSVPVDPLTRSLSLRLTFHFDSVSLDDAADVLVGQRAGQVHIEPAQSPGPPRPGN